MKFAHGLAMTRAPTGKRVAIAAFSRAMPRDVWVFRRQLARQRRERPRRRAAERR